MAVESAPVPEQPGSPAKPRPPRRLLAALIALGALAATYRYLIRPVSLWRQAGRRERPEHTLLGALPAKTSGGETLSVELRKYASHIVAEVTPLSQLSDEEGEDLCLEQLAAYVDGDNLRRRKGPLARLAPRWASRNQGPEVIARTAPVRMEMGAFSNPPHLQGVDIAVAYAPQTLATVSLTMPSEYKALIDLPLPSDRNVSLRAVPEYYAAAAGFKGLPPTPGRVREVHTAILEALFHAGLEPQSGRGVMVYQYHDHPAIPGFLRWNEVVLYLEAKGVEDAAQRDPEEEEA